MAVATETTENRYHTIEVDRDLPLCEQVHYVNTVLSLETLVSEKCYLEKIENRDGHMTLTYSLWQ